MARSDSTRRNGSPAADEMIAIRGARVHNLRNLDLDIPRNRLVVVTGPSGSGKSSLVFDTIHAEARRQYIESLSAYARQFLDQLERPDVDLIDGLQPTISIDQRASIQNPRSTVATATELYDHLRLLYARLGQPYCHACGEAIRQQSPEQILDRLLGLSEGAKAMILAPLVRGRKGAHREAFAAVRKAGFVRVRVDGEVHELENAPELAPRKNHTIEAVVDRIVIRESVRARLAESIQLAVRYGDGLLTVVHLDKGGAWRDENFSTEYSCPSCQLSYDELEPRTFSFNSPYGACPACDGLGVRSEFDPDLLFPDRSLTIEGAVTAIWKASPKAARERHHAELQAFLKQANLDGQTPLDELSPKQIEALLRGDRRFAGLLPLLEADYEGTKRETTRRRLDAFRGQIVCGACGGARLRPEARHVSIGDKVIHEATALSVREAGDWFRALEFSSDEALVARPIMAEIVGRLGFLAKVGLDYLTLDRAADTLSGGELQRIRLASGIGSGLVGVCYVLDEPSIGLHQRDNERLIDALRDLEQQGNSVLVVEHDETVMRRADWLIDMGPGAGGAGGDVVAQGAPAGVEKNPASITGKYLGGALCIPVPAQRRAISRKRSITLEGATTNNLKDVTVRFPLSALVCVTGVSGSGKSSLLNSTFARALARRLHGEGPKPGPHRRLRGASQIDKLVRIDQSPIGRTPRSNPATYTGLFDEIRKVFAATREGRLRGYKAGRFSFNVKGGRCEECQGQGVKKIEMNFLPDLHVECPVCTGARFNRQTLEVRYRDRTIADILELSVDKAVEFFENFQAVVRMLRCLQEVGLGYLALGQSSTTLSGGEAQRIKLAAELGRVDTGKTLYLLDEPTTGLHFDDIKKLLAVLDRLVELGNTVIVIEHNLDVIKSADWIIDLGPQGGELGGYLLAEGTPEEVAAQPDNETGRHLRPLLAAVDHGA